MPEGDTIHRTAARLRPALDGKTLVAFTAPRLRGDRPRIGETITQVEAVGKHLLIHFDGGLVLQTHMKMTGSWHLYRAGEKWQKPKHLARVVVDVGDWLAVCFSAPVIQTVPAASLHDAGSPIGNLGPDLCLPEPDIAAAVDRMAAIAEAATSIAEVLLDQRIACGIGNVYKSEALWATRTSPFTPVAEIDRSLRHEILETVARQLRSNLNRSRRETIPGGLAVYGRQRQPCPACGTPVRREVHGAHARSTYWCPSCQPAVVGP